MVKSGYLVDTDVIINYLKGKSKSKEFFMKIIDGKVLASSLLLPKLSFYLEQETQKKKPIFTIY